MNTSPPATRTKSFTVVDVPVADLETLQPVVLRRGGNKGLSAIGKLAVISLARLIRLGKVSEDDL